ncbi:hypothetical protein EDB19DRAFT_1826951 [Suillus lakei]|nr:hypothetical protein EDB19DRAFT_1826951 [Suillus lakei]
MYQHHSSNDTTLRGLIAEQSPWWNVRSRTRPGQEYCWVAINHDEPRVGGAPVKSSQRSQKDVDSNILSDDDCCGLHLHAIIHHTTQRLPVVDRCFSTEVALTAKIEGVRRGILDQYGFVVYNLVRDPDWKTRSLLAPLVGKIIDTGLIHCSFRGCIVDFNKIAHHDLLNLLRDQVPVHYQWFPTDIGPLDPCTLKATDYNDFNWETYHTREMKTDEKQHGEIKKPGQAAKVVKGEALFYKMSKKGRNKTLISRAEYNRISQSCHVVRLNLLTGEVCTVFEDEQTQTRHEETPAIVGTPVVTLGVMNAVPVDSEVQAETPHKRTQTQTCREEMPAVAGMPVVTLGVMNAVPSEIQAETPHKQTCMVADTQALVLPNIKNTNAQNGQRAETLVSLGEDDTGPTTLQFPSAPGSPPVPLIVSLPRQSSHCQFLPHPPILIPNALPSNKGLQLIRSAYEEDMYLIIGPPVYLRLSGIIFPATPAPRLGTLVMSFQSAIRVAHDIYDHPAASPAASVPNLLRRGASYRVFTPISQVTRVPSLTRGHPSYLDSRNTYPELLNFKDPNYWNTYLARVQALLRRPYVRRFLTMGGILWHLALQFGPPSLLNDALAGPSLDVTTWGIGEVNGQSWDDSVTAADIAMLIGVSGTGSCWPPHDVWNSSCRWKGFWSDADEQWFQSHLRNLSSGNTEAGKTRKDWKHFFRPISAARSSDTSIYGSEAFAHVIPTWDLVSADSTSIVQLLLDKWEPDSIQ